MQVDIFDNGAPRGQPGDLHRRRVRRPPASELSARLGGAEGGEGEALPR